MAIFRRNRNRVARNVPPGQEAYATPASPSNPRSGSRIGNLARNIGMAIQGISSRIRNAPPIARAAGGAIAATMAPNLASAVRLARPNRATSFDHSGYTGHGRQTIQPQAQGGGFPEGDAGSGGFGFGANTAQAFGGDLMVDGSQMQSQSSRDTFNTMIFDLLKKAQGIDRTELYKRRAAIQRGLLGRGSELTPEELRQLTPAQQQQIRNADIGALEPELDGINAQIQADQDKADRFYNSISALKDMGYGTEEGTMGGLNKDQRSWLNTIQDNARQDENIKSFPAVRASYELARSAAQRGGGAGDIVLMRMLAKITDPTTGVREEEFRTFESAQSTLARFGIALTKKMWSGGRLNESGRAALLQQVEDVYRQRETAYQNSLQFFNNQIQQSGIQGYDAMPYYVAPSGGTGGGSGGGNFPGFATEW